MQWFTKMTYNPEFAVDFKKAMDSLKGEKIAVVSHIRPDGDAIGSQVATTRSLIAMGLDAIAVYDDATPHLLKPFIEDTTFVHVDSMDLKGYKVIAVDCSNLERLGEKITTKVPEIFINIDHHVSNTQFAQHNFVIPEASATCEILAELFFTAGMPIDTVAAQALYLGIATDTGQFRYGNTTARVFEICQQLVNLGASPITMSNLLYERQNFNRIKLLNRFLESLKLELNGQVCIGSLNEDIYKQTGTSPEDSEGFVDYARSIDGVKVGLFLEERDGGVKGSLRAKNNDLDLDQFAKPFNGGGHAAAAGFRMKNTDIDTVYNKIINALAEHIK